MNAERLLAHYEKIADALDAIARLRRFILDLAVRGKLVPQDPKEEAAKGFKKPTDPVAPFGLPGNWKWIEIGDQLDLLNGMAFKPTDWSREGLRIVRIQNLNNPEAPFNFCNPEMARERSLIDNGSFLISWSGTPGTSFGAFIWDRGPAVLNQHIFRCDFKTKAFIAAFLRLAINGRLDEMIAKAHGGVGLQHITKGKLEALLIPLPPLAEQRRIVAKVDELMGLCDRLEVARAGREGVRDRLAAASLARLNAPDPETFQVDVRFALDALPALTTRPDQIKQLRHTILNLAVRGKLVPQDPNDEPASELLKRIAKAKAEQIKAGIAKREKPTEREAFPFALPISWSWCVLGQLCQLITKGSSPKWQGISYVARESGLIFITSENVGNFTLRKLDELKYVEARFKEVEPRSMLRKGDILINLVGASIGRTAIYNLDNEANINQAVSLVRLVDPTIGPSIDYLLMFLNSDAAVDLMLGSRVITAQPNISLTDVNGFPIPLPPLAEQHRIVAKVDALMALCDRLEASLTATAAARRRLLDALLAEALAPTDDRELEAAE